MAHRLALGAGIILFWGCSGKATREDGGLALDTGASLDVAEADGQAAIAEAGRDGQGGAELGPVDAVDAVEVTVDDAKVGGVDARDEAAGDSAVDSGDGSGCPTYRPGFGVGAKVSFDAVRIGTRSFATVRATVSSQSPPLSLSVSAPGGEFIVTHDGCTGAAVGPGQSCEIALAFVPTSTGEKTALLAVSAPGACGGTATAMLSGKGVAAPAGPLVINKEEVDFDLQLAGCWRSSVMRVFNLGAAVTAPLAATVSGDFTLGNDGCGGLVLTPGGSCDIEVLSKPQQRQGLPIELSGTLAVSAGPGITDQTRLLGESRLGDSPVTITPQQLQFGVVAVGATSPPRRVTVAHLAGSLPVMPSARSTANDFIIVRDTCSGEVLSSGWCEIDVSYRPNGVGDRTASLLVTVPQPMCIDGPAMVNLSGSGTP